MQFKTAALGAVTLHLAILGAVADSILTIPRSVVNATSIGQYISSASGFDFPKVYPFNSSAYDWWYFDAVSEDQQYSIVVTLLVGAGTAFPTGLPSDAILVGAVYLQSPNLPSLQLITEPASEAVVISEQNGASGIWKNSGIQFRGADDLSSYAVGFDVPSAGLYGSMALNSIAPPHYPAGPAIAGQSMVILPGVGWANAIPDAKAEICIMLNDTEVKFTGVGYHDKNWGTSPFIDHVGSWYWGHGRLGPYSIVWFDALTPTGEEYVSGYVAKDNKILFAGNHSTIVRPTGVNDTYPPKAGIIPDGYRIDMDMGKAGKLEVDVAATLIYGEEATYHRWVAKLSGGVDGEPECTGTAILEAFTLES